MVVQTIISEQDESRLGTHLRASGSLPPLYVQLTSGLGQPVNGTSMDVDDPAIMVSLSLYL